MHKEIVVMGKPTGLLLSPHPLNSHFMLLYVLLISLTNCVFHSFLPSHPFPLCKALIKDNYKALLKER
jgi:hypothetical protein